MSSRMTASWISVARSPSTRGRVVAAVGVTGPRSVVDDTKLFRSIPTVRRRFIRVKRAGTAVVPRRLDGVVGVGCHHRCMTDNVDVVLTDQRRYPHGVPSWVDVTQPDVAAG